MKLMNGFDSNYRFVLVAARRARQLQSGSRSEVATKPAKACRVAQDEVMAGKVEWEITPLRSELVDPMAEFFAENNVGGEPDL